MTTDSDFKQFNPCVAPQAEAAFVAPVPATPTLPARKPRVWTVFATFIAAFVAVIGAQVVGAVALVVWYFAQGGTPQQLQAEILDLVTAPGPFIGMNLLSQLAMGGTAVAAAFLSPQPLRERLGLVAPSLGAGSTSVLILGAIVPTLIGLSLAYALAEVIEPDENVQRLYAQMTAEWAIPFIVFIALGPGICEELLFRGYMQRRLLERWGTVAAITLVSLLFAVVHAMPHAIVFALPIGVWLGLLAWRTGSTWPGILCHAAVNGVWNIRNVGIALGYLPEESPIWFLVVLGIVGAITFVWSLGIIFGTPRPTSNVTGTPATPAAPAP
jgi:membrane protease YdiL (CAAX protease family)